MVLLLHTCCSKKTKKTSGCRNLSNVKIRAVNHVTIRIIYILTKFCVQYTNNQMNCSYPML